MEIKLIIGGRYAVSTDSVCRVTYMREGKEREYVTAFAGKQEFFVAQSQVAYIDDENADVTLFPDAPTAIDWLCGGGDNSGLPAGYKRVEYLESTGTQWLNTGYIANSETTTKIRWAFIEDLGNIGFIFYPDAGVPRFGMLRNKSGTIRCDYGEAMDLANKVLDIGRVYDLEKRGRFNFVDGELVITNPETEPFEQPAPMLISTPKSMYRAVFRLYSFIMENNNKSLNLIPALDNTGTPCMYDLVSKQPFYNSGTGDFLYPGKETQATTYSLRRPRMYAQMTPHGIRRLYHVPRGYNGTPEEYAEANGFKILVETPQPEEGYWAPVWRETEDCIELEWIEAEPPVNEEIGA